MRISSGTTGQSLPCLGLIWEDRKDFAEADEIEGAAHAGNKGADRHFSRVGFRTLIVFDECCYAGRVHVGNGGKVQQKSGSFCFGLLPKCCPESGGLIEIDLTRNDEDRDRIFIFFLNLHRRK